MKEKYHKNSFIESKWINDQVEGHILFGLHNTTQKALWITVVYVIYLCFYWIIIGPFPEETGLIVFFLFRIEHIIALALIFYFAFFSNLSQSVLFWLATKITLAFMSLIFFLLGIVNMLKGYEYWFVWPFLGFVWLPSFEFLPVLSKYQKIFDILRVFVSLVIYLLI